MQKSFLLIPALLSAANWPQFRGPGAHGRAEGSAPVKIGPSAGFVWKIEMPAGHSSPSIWGNRIFLTSGDKAAKTLDTICVDRTTGKLLWRQTLQAEKIERLHQIANPASATAAVDGERVYVYFGSYGLAAYNMAGERQWTAPLPLPEKANGSGTSPVLAGDLVLLSRDDPGDAYLLAVDRRSGKTVWKQSLGVPDKNQGAANTATPLLWTEEIVVHRSAGIVAVDRKTGEKTWWVNLRSTGVGSPVAGTDMVYVSTWTNFGEPDLRVPQPDFAALLKEHDKDGDGVVNAEEFPAMVPLARRPEASVKGVDLTLPGRMIFGGIDRNKDGKVDKAEWEAVRANASKIPDHGLMAIRGGGKGGSYFASPVAAGGNVYFSSADGIVAIIRDSDQFEMVSANDLQEPIFATPAVADGMLYVRTDKHLYAFGGETR